MYVASSQLIFLHRNGLFWFEEEQEVWLVRIPSSLSHQRMKFYEVSSFPLGCKSYNSKLLAAMIRVEAVDLDTSSSTSPI